MLKKITLFAIAILVVYSAVAFLYISYKDLGKQEILAFVFAGLLASINIIIALTLIEKNLQKSEENFVKSFMLSTLIRLFFLILIFLLIMTILSLNHFVFSVAFFILYFLFQMVEIYILQTLKQPDTLK